MCALIKIERDEWMVLTDWSCVLISSCKFHRWKSQKATPCWWLSGGAGFRVVLASSIGRYIIRSCLNYILPVHGSTSKRRRRRRRKNPRVRLRIRETTRKIETLHFINYRNKKKNWIFSTTIHVRQSFYQYFLSRFKKQCVFSTVLFDFAFFLLRETCCGFFFYSSRCSRT